MTMSILGASPFEVIAKRIPIIKNCNLECDLNNVYEENQVCTLLCIGDDFILRAVACPVKDEYGNIAKGKY
jgi:hypothetical protein